MRDNLTPLEVCERLIGPPAVIAELLGYVRTAPVQWRRGAENRDAGDLPSARIMRSLLAHAAARKIPLTAEMLIWGASAAEIEALAAAPLPPQEAAE